MAESKNDIVPGKYFLSGLRLFYFEAARRLLSIDRFCMTFSADDKHLMKVASCSCVQWYSDIKVR